MRAREKEMQVGARGVGKYYITLHPGRDLAWHMDWILLSNLKLMKQYHCITAATSEDGS